MTEEVKNHPEIGTFTHVDAEGSDDKQIADIDDLLAGGTCSALIVSPNSTAALTPAVEKACASGLPVIVFDPGWRHHRLPGHLRPPRGWLRLRHPGR